MPRRQLTAEQIKARTEKARKTREAKKQAALAMLGETARPKIKKKRKLNLTDEQRAERAERLKKARKKKGEPKHTQYAPEVVALRDEDPLSLKNVRQYIKASEQLLTAMRDFKDSKVMTERLQYADVQTYIDNLKTYLRTGAFCDFRVGNDRQTKLKQRCVAMAYHRDGTPKRTVGVWYPDIGTEWTQEMERVTIGA